MQVEAVFMLHTSSQVMPCSTQTDILNAAFSVVAQTKKTNAATIAIIDQRTVGVTNVMTMIAKNAGIVSLNNGKIKCFERTSKGDTYENMGWGRIYKQGQLTREDTEIRI